MGGDGNLLQNSVEELEITVTVSSPVAVCAKDRLPPEGGRRSGHSQIQYSTVHTGKGSSWPVQGGSCRHSWRHTALAPCRPLHAAAMHVLVLWTRQVANHLHKIFPVFISNGAIALNLSSLHGVILTSVPMLGE